MSTRPGGVVAKVKDFGKNVTEKAKAAGTVIASIALYRGRFGKVVAAKLIRHQQTQHGKSSVQHPMQPFFRS